jgi:hypothetical protein
MRQERIERQRQLGVLGLLVVFGQANAVNHHSRLHLGEYPHQRLLLLCVNTAQQSVCMDWQEKPLAVRRAQGTEHLPASPLNQDAKHGTSNHATGAQYQNSHRCFLWLSDAARRCPISWSVSML